MDRHLLLDRAAAEFRARLDLVTPQQWGLPTPCEEWDVRGLVNHVITASLTGERLLQGASREETIAMIGLDFIADDDPIGAFERSCKKQASAFRVPGALELVVHHPAFDMPGSQLLDFRIGDTLLHAWDLARAIGADASLDPELVEFVWASLEPLADALPASGAFGAGPSGDVSAEAPRQFRLLDLSGRRP